MGKRKSPKKKEEEKRRGRENTKDILHSIDGKPSPFRHAKMCCSVKLGRNDDILLPKLEGGMHVTITKNTTQTSRNAEIDVET